MTLGQILLTYGLLPVLIVTVVGIRRARRAQAGWIAWSPVLLYLATIVVAFLMGFADAALGLSGAIVQAVVYLFGLASAVSGIWLFFRFSPKTPET
jgi:hypothetical protein